MSDPLFDVAGRTVLVAGTGGLGAAIAEALATRGARLVLADLDEMSAAALAQRLPGEDHRAIALDVADEASCAAAVAACDGAPDGLVNCVGVFRIAPALELPLATFETSLRINVTGTFALARAAAKAMIAAGRKGRIVTLSSVSSRVANPTYAAYATSKAALVQLTRILALEWAAHGITVNAVGPAMTPTPLTEEYLAKDVNPDYALSKIPVGRFGAPNDIVGAVLLLLAPAGAFITGQTIYVDGGRTLL